MRRAGVALAVVIVACGARTDLGGERSLDRDGGDAGDAASDANFGEAGPPPPPCKVTQPTLLASGGKEIQFVALDQDDVFWTDFALGTVSAVAKGGGDARVIAAGRESPSGVAAKDGVVYWTEFNGDMVASAPASGGASTTIAANQDGAYDVTLSGSAIYWTTFRGCTVSRIDAGKSTQLDKAKQPFSDIASAGPLVFWISFEKKSVERYDATSNTRSTIVDGGTTPPFAIATDGTNLYFGETSAAATTIGFIPTAGGGPKTLFSSECTEDGGLVGTCLAGLATDGTTLYFTGEGRVRKMPVGGGEPTVVADQQARPYAVAVDDSCVYWSNLGDGTVWAAPK